ncbi:MAG: putative alpha/beta superfamily hydrolase [Saprospiraceae bacterium]|jgi:predicted alpha/beta superfamily hydrolase
MNFKILINILIVIICCTIQQAQAQPKYLFEIGVIDSLYSTILNEQREIYVQLPASFDSNAIRKYPVVYVLDGEVLLNAVSTVHSYYWGGFIPEMIIVGISNRNHRTRDLTTSEINTRYGMEYNQESGGAEKFTNFIENELIPYMDSKYPTSDYKTLIGHSYAGLFTINTLINHTHLFDNYLAIDPSLDWDNQKLLKQSEEVLKSKNFKGKSLFISLGGILHMQNNTIDINNVMQDTSAYTLFARSNVEFSNLLKQNEENGLSSNWKFYENDFHGTIPLPSIMDGLLSFFTWYIIENVHKFNDPETPTNELVKIIKNREQKLLDHFGYPVPPFDEELFIMSGYMYLEMGKIEKALTFFQLNIDYYPLSANAYDSLADFYKTQNDFENALKNASKAFEISGDPYHKKRMEDFEAKINKE